MQACMRYLFFLFVHQCKGWTSMWQPLLLIHCFEKVLMSYVKVIVVSKMFSMSDQFFSSNYTFDIESQNFIIFTLQDKMQIFQFSFILCCLKSSNLFLCTIKLKFINDFYNSRILNTYLYMDSSKAGIPVFVT